jgi:transposase
MSTTEIYHHHGIKDYKYLNMILENGTTTYKLKNSKGHCCSECNSGNVTLDNPNERIIQLVPVGTRAIYANITVWRCSCKDCGSRKTEKVKFLSHKKARISRSLERFIVEMRQHMTITSIAKIYGIDSRIIKKCEKKYLGKKFKRIRLRDVKIIGMDEIYISPKNKKYITIIRDLETGAVLYVGDGRSKDTLKGFTRKLNASKHKIKTIAMDMSGPFKSWAKENLPEADIVFDHFHVIKLMNKHVNSVRIATMKKLDKKQKEDLIGTKFLWLKAEGKLKEDAAEKLERLRETFADLGEINLMKEYLRGIYKNVSDPLMARGALIDWCDMANSSEIIQLKKMAKTIKNHIDGIVSFWSTNGVTNAAMEGFNTKIRCLIKQAYGYHDMEYFHLKIFDLPARKIKQVI